MRKLFFVFLLFFFSMGIGEVYGCTSAIISGRLTPDGRPLMLKHRDTGELNNRVASFQGPLYSFIGLVNSPAATEEVWGGTNQVGFSIVNTASYNLKDDDVKEMDREGYMMYKALGQCRTLKDFELFLDDHPRPMRVESNFAVIDAEGGAAYYEVNNTSWKKFDVNDPDVAPDGYFVVTNFSYSGRPDEGMGYVRHTAATRILAERADKGNITPKWIFDHISRSFYHPVLGIDLKSGCLERAGGSGWFIDQDFIPRRSSSASLVIQGVKPGEDAAFTTMWTVLGYPPLGVAIPLLAAFAEDIPHYMKKGEGQNALLCDMALELKKDVFSITRGNGEKYFNFNKLYNSQGNGYSQIISDIEGKLTGLFLEKMDRWRKSGMDRRELQYFYRQGYEDLIIVGWPERSY